MDGHGGLVDDDEASRATYATDDESDTSHVKVEERNKIFSAIGRNTYLSKTHAVPL